MDDNSAQNNRPMFTAEEVGAPTQDVIPHNDAGSHPQHLPAADRDPGSEPGMTTSPQPNETPSHVKIPGNKVNKPHVLSRMFFLIPAILIVGTIAVVAYVTRQDFVINEDQTETNVIASSLPTSIPSPTPTPEVQNINFENEFFSIVYNKKFQEVECEQALCLSFDAEKSAITFEYINKEEEVEIDKFNRVYLLGDRKLLIKLFDNNFSEDFDKILSSLKILVNISSNWKIFENSAYSYYLKYPQDWNLVNFGKDETEITNRSVVQKNLNETKLQNLIIETQSELDNAALTATESVSSTKGLLGWDNAPTSEISNIGGVNAQIISGEFEGNWQEYIIVWYRNVVIQMIWTDDILRSNQQVVDEILKSFQVY